MRFHIVAGFFWSLFNTHYGLTYESRAASLWDGRGTGVLGKGLKCRQSKDESRQRERETDHFGGVESI
jgi:hypothetical protein